MARPNVKFETLVSLLEAFVELNAPVVFKGAVVLRIATSWLNLQTLRTTGDLDMDWAEGTPTMEQLIGVVEQAVHKIDDSLVAYVKRPYSVTSTAGFIVQTFDGLPYCRLDIGIKPERQFCREYRTSNGVPFLASMETKMVADKLSGISDRAVFRRMKDVYDLCILSRIGGYKLRDVYDIWRVDNKSVGDFSYFCNDVDGLRHAYSKMLNIVNKPEFDDLYRRVSDFARPFIDGLTFDLVWNGYMWIKPERQRM